MTTVAFPEWTRNSIRWRVEVDVITASICEFYLARLENDRWCRCDQHGHALRSAPALLKAHIEADAPAASETIAKVVDRAHSIAAGCRRSDEADLNRTAEFIRAEGEWAEISYRAHRPAPDCNPLVVR